MAFTEDTINEIVEAADPDYIAGLSILGGEPLADYNLESTRKLIAKFKEVYPEKTIWLWTGYEYSEIKELLDASGIDVAIVGRFELDKRDITNNNLWRGSTNQRVIDVKNKCFLAGIPNNN